MQEGFFEAKSYMKVVIPGFGYDRVGSQKTSRSYWVVPRLLFASRWLRRHEEDATAASSRTLHVLQMGEVTYSDVWFVSFRGFFVSARHALIAGDSIAVRRSSSLHFFFYKFRLFANECSLSKYSLKMACCGAHVSCPLRKFSMSPRIKKYHHVHKLAQFDAN